MSIETLVTGPARPRVTLFLAHGAGAGMQTPFMDAIADGLAKQKVGTIRFLFPYMSRVIKEGKSLPPDREPVLRDAWHQVLNENRRKRFLIGGKSMGGRMASLIADEVPTLGLVCLGYPFHPPGRPEKLRLETLKKVQVPTLIAQGERDPFGNREEVKSYRLRKPLKVHWIKDGEHSFKPRKSSGATLEGNLDEAVKAIVEFIDSLDD